MAAMAPRGAPRPNDCCEASLIACWLSGCDSNCEGCDDECSMQAIVDMYVDAKQLEMYSISFFELYVRIL